MTVSKKSRYAATWTWNGAHTTLTITIGANTAGSAASITGSRHLQPDHNRHRHALHHRRIPQLRRQHRRGKLPPHAHRRILNDSRRRALDGYLGAERWLPSGDPQAVPDADTLGSPGCGHAAASPMSSKPSKIDSAALGVGIEPDRVTEAPPRPRGKRNVLPMLRSRAAFLEQALLVVLAALATMYVERIILFTPHLYATDTMLLEYWMRRFQDPGLFQDPLTHALVETGYVPLGSQAVYWLASNVVDPIQFGAWGVLVLAPLSTWLVFRIVREHTAWIPAAWLAAALFVLSWQNQRFSGTHPRAFAQPIVLLTVFLLMRGRTRWAAAVPAAGALFYPPAALVALGVVFLSAIGAHGRRLTVDRRTLVSGAASAAVMLDADQCAMDRRAIVGQPHHGVRRSPLPRVRPERPGAVLPGVGEDPRQSYARTIWGSPSRWAEAS